MIALTFLTKRDCAWCAAGKEILAELSHEFPLHIDEVSLETEEGQRLGVEHQMMFAPGLIADGRLISHGRMSKRALRRDLLHLTEAR